MAKSTLYDFNIDNPEEITDELYSSVGADAFKLGDVKRAFKGSTDVVIRTASGGGGDLLIEGVDYNIVNEDFEYTELCGYHVYTGIQILTVGYQSVDLYISYKCVGSYTTVASLNALFAQLSIIANTWATSTYYEAGTIVKRNYTIWLCETSHTSGTFAIDWLSNGYWSPLSPPPGSVMMLGKSAIAGITGWLMCDNSAINRTTYADLYAVIATAFGVGNGSTTFNIPDFRGIFPRGAGTSAKLSRADGAAFAGTLGNYQNDKGHAHIHLTCENWTSNPRYGRTGIASGIGGSYTGAGNYTYAGNVSIPYAYSIYGTPRIGGETNPANLGINFIIKY